jgi:hypothetical protein
MRWIGWVGAALALAPLGCGSDPVPDDELGISTGETSDPSSDDPCELVLDPATFAAGPIVSPEPWVGTPECPALTLPMILALPTPIEVTGSVVVDGEAWDGYVEFHGRDGEGQVTTQSELGTGFAVELLPGRYDVHAALEDLSLQHFTLVLEDVDLGEPVNLELELPAPIQVTGSMTMDGEPAPDPFGYIEVRSTTSDSDDEGVVLVMAAGDYALTLAPGEYRFVYRWCNRSEILPSHAWTICSALEGPAIPEDEPRIGSEQDWAPFHTATLEDSGVLDLDVPTARVSGTLTFEGVAPLTLARFIRFDVDDQHGFVYPEADGSFDTRIVRGTYEAVLGSFGGRAPELDVISEDIHVDIHRDAVPLTAIEPEGYPMLRIAYTSRNAELYAWRSDVRFQDDDLYWTGDDELDPVLWPGLWNLAVGVNLCWPDTSSGGRYIRIPFANELDLHGPTALGDIQPEFAPVHIDLVAEGGYVLPSENDELKLELVPEHGLVPTDEFVPDRGSYSFSDELDVHGYLVPGRYRVLYADSLLGTVDLEPGSTLMARPRFQVFAADWTIGGEPAGAASSGYHLFLRNLDTGHLRLYHDVGEHGPNTLAPGRYELIYVGWDEHGDGFPDNTDPKIGCVTVEG